MFAPVLSPAATAGFASGFGLSASLIMAIGAQNLFVLRQGLQRLHVGPVVLFCVAADVALIAIGVAGLQAVIAAAPWLQNGLTLGGALFLAWYAVCALRRSFSPAAVNQGGGSAVASLPKTLRQTASFTFLNPHVYVDTVLLMGSVGSSQPGMARAAFIVGAGMFSAIWFVSLGFGARLLAPVFRKPAAWRVLDAVMGVVLLILAASLAARLRW